LFTARRPRAPKLVVVVEIHAHRAGPLRHGIPLHAEQTLPAFAHTWSRERVVCELDVRFTADRVAVVFHDPDLMRMTGTGGRLHALDAAAFRALRTDLLGADRRLALAAAPVALATLEEVLALARDHRGRLNVELKNLPWQPGFDSTEATGEQLAAVLRGCGIAEHRLTVQSFWAADLAVLGRRLPGVMPSLLVERGTEDDGIERALLAGAGGGRARVARGPRHGAPRPRPRPARDGLHLNPPAAVRDAAAAGVDVIITDDPAMARRALAPLPALAAVP
jgi:glycerophosphoryl diester phosphodiesterase